MAKIDGGEMFVRVLKQQGIDTVFTLHGGHLDSIFQAALDYGIRLIDTRHEQAAGHAADGWARTTGRPGVAIVTAGPGVTDVVTAVANAYLDCVPTLFVGGAAPLSDAEMLPLQGGLDQVEMLKPVTKWSHRITHTERIPDLVAQALRIATTGRPGPVFLEMPVDVLFKKVDEEALSFAMRVVPEAAPAPNAGAIARALEWLEGAERPAILAGGGAWFAQAGAELLQFAEMTGTPVFTNGKARGMVPDTHALACGPFTNLGMLAQSGYQPDVLLILGARLGMFTGGRSGSVIPPGARVIQIDIEGEEIGRNREIELGIAADVREALTALNAGGASRKWRERGQWQRAARAARETVPAAFAPTLAANGRIHPYRLAHQLAALADPDAIIVADGGETHWWMELNAKLATGGSWMSHGYLGCLGVGLPFAAAAKAAHPERQVICISGDGSIGLNFAEFDTLVRHKLNVVTIVNNDQQWGMSRHGQELMFGKDRTVVTELGPTRYDLAAAGFGCHSEFVTEADDLEPALRRALAAGRPACVNVLTDPDVIAPVTMAMVGGGRQTEGKMNLPYYGEREG